MANRNPNNNNDTNFAQRTWESFNDTIWYTFQMIVPEGTYVTTEHCGHWMENWEQLDKTNIPKREKFQIRICDRSSNGNPKLFLNDEACLLFISFLLKLHDFNAVSSSLSLCLEGSKAHDVRLLEGLKCIPLTNLDSSRGLCGDGIGEGLHQLLAAQKDHIAILRFWDMSDHGGAKVFPRIIGGLRNLLRLESLDLRCCRGHHLQLRNVLNSLIHSGANKRLRRLCCDFRDCSRSSMELLASRFKNLHCVGNFHDVSLEALQGLHQSTSIRLIFETNLPRSQAEIFVWIENFERRNELFNDYLYELKAHPDTVTNPKLWPTVVRRLGMTKEMSPVFAFLHRHLDSLDTNGRLAPQTIRGGTVCTMPFAEFVARVRLELKTDRHPLRARIEVLQGPDEKAMQVIEVNNADGMKCVVVETPGAGNVVRIVNMAEETEVSVSNIRVERRV